MARKTTPGIEYMHGRNCAGRATCGKNCNESPEPWQAWVYDAKYVDPATGRRGKKIRRRFGTFAAARSWRGDALGEVRRRTLRATDRATAQKTLREEVAEWLAGAEAGQILNKREQPYKPAVLRNYELALRLRVLPTLGDRRLSDVTLADLLDLKEKLQGSGVSASTVRNSFVPLAAIYRRARLQQRIVIDPTTDLPLPTAGVRDRAATPREAQELLTALSDAEQGIWAAAFYAGLRRGELRALRVSNVDLDAALISVEHGWDDKEGEIAPKSRAGARTVFVLDALQPYLAPLVEGRGADEFVFGGDHLPFDPRAVARKAERVLNAIDKARAEEADEDEHVAPIARFTLHEARHSFSTWMDHAGVSPDRANRYMGHGSSEAPSRYRHLLPAQIAEDRKNLDAYLSGVSEGKVVALAAAG